MTCVLFRMRGCKAKDQALGTDSTVVKTTASLVKLPGRYYCPGDIGRYQLTTTMRGRKAADASTETVNQFSIDYRISNPQ